MKCHLGELSLSCASKEGVRKVGWVGAGEQWKIFQNENRLEKIMGRRVLAEFEER